MKRLFVVLYLMAMSIASFGQENKEGQSEVPTPEHNNWSTNKRMSNFHLGLDVQTKYLWRGMEMIPEASAPALFPCINYQLNGLYVYAMGGYDVNGKYAEVDFGISYSWKDLTVAINDYYYPTINGKDDEYLGGMYNGHWLEAAVTYALEKLPLWITISNFFSGDDDKYAMDNGEMKQAYSTYIEVGTYYDFLDNNRISMALGMTPNKSCYTNYQKDFAVCNIDLKYTYNVRFGNGWSLPLSAEYVYNPVFDKSFMNFIVNIAF